MKRKLSLKMLLPLLLIFSGCAKQEAAEPQPYVPVKEKGTVVILATGGTIAGSGETGRETGYRSGSLDVDSLIKAAPGIEKLAHLETVQVCNVNSDDITEDIWLRLADTIHMMAQDENVKGFVITHGTDTLEETAYFLNLVLKTDKPVVLTGSMRPATAISADGPMNLYQSVCVAADANAAGKGVMAVFSNRIYSARSVKKSSTYSAMAISAGEMGQIGIVRNDTAYFYLQSVKRHTTNSEFSAENVKKLPRVNIVYFSVDASPEILRHAASISDGIVIAGAGAGEFSEKYIEEIRKMKIPVVISSRINEGLITQDAVLCENTVAANDLPPQKAAILLRLALLQTKSQDELIRIFSEY